MKKMLVMVAIWMLTACQLYNAPRKVDRAFNYTGKSNELVGGRVYMHVSQDDSSFVHYMVLYHDGTLVFLNNSYFNYLGVQSIQELLARNVSANRSFNRTQDWGYYEVIEDTLFAHSMGYRTHGNGYWFDHHPMFRVIKDPEPGNEKLVWIGNSDQKEMTARSKAENEWNFYDTCACTISDSYLKYDEWFWKSEDHYNQWIERSGGDKKKYWKE